ncbi:MAG: 4-vinyl reductase [Aquificae bacterium]|nr:4-vinyl reductase [Aquificota bacterium]
MEREEVVSQVRTFLRSEGLILPQKPIKEFYAQIFKLAGLGIGGVLTLSGKKAGEIAAEIIKSISEGRNLSTEEIFEYVGAFFGETRIARLKLKEVKEGEIIVGFEDCVFAEAIGKSRKPACLPVSGALSGLLSSLTGERWECKEVECRAQGKELCLFQLKKK